MRSRNRSGRHAPEAAVRLRVPTTLSSLATVIALSGTAYAQNETPAPSQQPVEPGASGREATESGDPIEEVLVTGRRQAIENATERKKAAESIIDSVVAEDAGMLPDKSITEVLQRVSGVAIVRFGALNDPDHFAAEGTGVQVRGLSGVASRLNGREIFSANNGRGLSWADITPELMAAVDVYKASTPDLIEGGTGGQIDLRTKMPFDFNKPAVQASLSGSYGDLIQETKPGGSLLMTDRWSTRAGEIGVLVDLAYSDYSQNYHFFRLDPYYRTRVGDQDRFIPGGYAYGDQDYERTRRGVYVGLQWQPTDNLTFSQTYFLSKYDDWGAGSGPFVTARDQASGNGFGVDPNGNAVFDSNGALIQAGNLFLRDRNTFGPSTETYTAGGNAGIVKTSSDTWDLATGFNWNVGERWAIRGAFQLVNSKWTRDSYDLFSRVPFPSAYSLDLTGSLPQVTMSSAALSALENPAAYEWEATMDNVQRNEGELRATNLDFDYTLSDSGFFRTLGFGARYADRSERDNNSGFNWTALGRGWNGDIRHFSDARPGDVEGRVYENFFRGDISVPTAMLMPSWDRVAMFDPFGDHAAYGGDAGTAQAIVATDLTRSDNTNSAMYTHLRFASDTGILGIPFAGSVGVRVTRIENDASGFFQQSAETFFRDGVQYTMPEITQERSGSTALTKALPAINFNFRPAQDVQLRLAYNITMDQPSFNALRANGTAGADTTNVNGVDVLSGFTTDSGNPLLRPVISHNTDISLEWYPTRGTATHMSFFHKSIDDWITYGSVIRPIPITYSSPRQETVTELVEVNEVFNSPRTATVKGIEFGGRTFFERLPAPWNGLGVEANYTYIDSKNPGDRYFDIDGIERTDATVQGLSKNNLNLVGMFERGKLSMRLAYSWRSEYLMTTNGNGTNGDYTYYSAPGVGTFRDISLPIYSDDYGQLDFGTTYRLTDEMAFSFELSNLTDEIGRTLQGGYPSGTKYVRSWFMQDRRAVLTMRYSF